MSEERKSVSYERRMGFVAPAKLADAVSRAAADKMQSVNSWLRQACVAALKENDDEKTLRSR
jgi:hypothetical protein